MQKARAGNYFEDFAIGQVILHGAPRTLTAGDASLYVALYGSRFAVQSSSVFAESLGYKSAPLDDMLVFHIVFGKSVPDLSLNAVANLGYAECRFLQPVYCGDTLFARSEVIGLKENSNRQTGVVYVRTSGFNQRDELVLEFVRWVMVRKRDVNAPAPEAKVPAFAEALEGSSLAGSIPPLNIAGYDFTLAGGLHRFGDYAAGEKIDHLDGMTIEEAEHQLATRLYQNTAKVHFNQHTESHGRFGRRLVYGGHIISVARALSFNGLENAFHIAAINGGRHVSPAFAGNTIYAWSEVLDKADLGRTDVGALRLRLVALKDKPGHEFPLRVSGEYDPAVLLDLDYWAIIPH